MENQVKTSTAVNQETKPSILISDLKLYRFENLSENAKKVAIESFSNYVNMTYHRHISFELQDDEWYQEKLKDDYGIDVDSRSLSIEIERSWLAIEISLKGSFFEKIIDSFEGNVDRPKQYVKECFDLLKDGSVSVHNFDLSFQYGELQKLRSGYVNVLSDDEMIECFYLENEDDFNKIIFARDLMIENIEKGLQWLIKALETRQDYYDSEESIVDFINEGGDEYFFDVSGKPMAKLNYVQVSSNYSKSSNTVSFIHVGWDHIALVGPAIEFEEI